MNIEIILSLLSALCSLIGSLGGILVTSKLNLYRLEQLEKRLTSITTLLKECTKSRKPSQQQPVFMMKKSRLSITVSAT